MPLKKFDIIVLGSGSAGFSAVEAARAQGVSVCLIEKAKLGGECPNDACVPSKALLHAAKFFRHLSGASRLGIDIREQSFSFEKVSAYRQRAVDTLTGGGKYGDRYIQSLSRLKVEVRFGNASFIDAHTIEVAGEQLCASAFVIATGGISHAPNIPGLNDISLWSWKEAIVAKRQPKSLAIIGGGPVGCELATFYSAFGTRVILFQSAPSVLEKEDKAISLEAQKLLERGGVEVIVKANISEIVQAGGLFGVKLARASQQKLYAVEQVVLATGKQANITGLNLQRIGVSLDKKGFIRTKTSQQTSVSHVFAAGDVDGGMQFTHTAHHEGWIAGHNAALLVKKKTKDFLSRDERVVPRVTFLDSEVASVGATQEEAQKKFGNVLVGNFSLASLGRSVTQDIQTGMIKLVAHTKTRKLLGAHMIGERAGEVIHEAAMAMHLGATVDKIASMIHAYPTFSEGLKGAAANVKKVGK